ncbi:hypothetical protein GCM10010912_17910 [Paenibacillus albidus]|uniref:Uncharacterized protein n=1 Tax=Paenibacillus albidus TaxID=2041023 RepID=A0A917FDI1_9BACL|nr:hypothetical protein GCM10010912_17910 [Paenibacillus albidus]
MTQVSTEEMICPHCGESQDNHEPDDMTYYMCQKTCEKCNEMFWYSVTVTREYTTDRGDEA